MPRGTISSSACARAHLGSQLCNHSAVVAVLVGQRHAALIHEENVPQFHVHICTTLRHRMEAHRQNLGCGGVCSVGGSVGWCVRLMVTTYIRQIVDLSVCLSIRRMLSVRITSG